ncbi:MAG: MltA domain-containing protein [Planctomycetes bacterium]|nr:MltA domain-containing protein [Planctomycetota bacterium]MBU1518149.1 MltA domain-containing protein [Planctomycetota bacterium]MBU2457069.1 MltA domain-containing protein [Planctomycetota bacterium]
MRKAILVAELLLISLFSASCHLPRRIEPVKKPPQYDRPLLPGQFALRKITNPADIPDFTFACYNLTNLRSAIAKSLNYLKKPSSKQFYPCGEITHEKAVQSLQAFDELFESKLFGDKLKEAILQKFDVYISVGCDDRGTVLFTGYYTPIFDGSLTRTEKFRYPLYKQPADLVKGPKGEILGRRSRDGVEPYPSRKVLEISDSLTGTELVWLGDPFEVYIAHVQGSAKIRLPNGKLMGVGYAASNGHEYKSLSKAMVEQGKIGGRQMSLTAMINYFKQHPDQVASYTQVNPRFVFFMEEKGEPRGSLNEEVTPYRSIATDKTIFPPACPTFISTRLPYEKDGAVSERPYTGFALDQDTGGAIRAPGRCDIYMGQDDKAGSLAGRTYQQGRLYYLFLK